MKCTTLSHAGVLPLWKNLKPRSVWVRMCRWRELVEVLRLLFQHKVLGKPVKVADLYLPSHKQHVG